MPELLQHDCTPEKLTAAVAPLLDEPQRRQSQIAAQDAALDRMGRGQGDPSARAAEAILDFLRERGRL